MAEREKEKERERWREGGERERTAVEGGRKVRERVNREGRERLR